ncbi:hypothetical protein M8494_11110 [Serratia ureilytica]
MDISGYAHLSAFRRSGVCPALAPYPLPGVGADRRARRQLQPGDGAQMAQAAPNGARIIENAKHMVSLTDAQRVNALMLDFRTSEQP